MFRRHVSRHSHLVRGLAATLALTAAFYALLGYTGSADMFGEYHRWRGMNKGQRTSDSAPKRFHSNPRTAFASRPRFLVADGYNALLVDLRGHGESGGTIISPGLPESHDIAVVIGDDAFLTGKQLSEDINRHYLQDSRTNLLLRSLFFVSTVPCAAPELYPSAVLRFLATFLR